MIRKDDRTYATIADASKEFGVSPKTIRDWIDRGIIEEPPKLEHGVRIMAYFPPEYMEKSKAQLKRYRDRRAAQSRKREG